MSVRRWTGVVLSSGLLVLIVLFAIVVTDLVNGDPTSRESVEPVIPGLASLDNRSAWETHRTAIETYLECIRSAGIGADGPWRQPDGRLQYVVETGPPGTPEFEEAVDCYTDDIAALDGNFQVALETLDNADDFPPFIQDEIMRDAPTECLGLAAPVDLSQLSQIWRDDEFSYIACLTASFG